MTLSHEDVRQQVLAGFHELGVTFDPVSELDFYLAVPVEQKLRIDPTHFDAIKTALGTKEVDA